MHHRSYSCNFNCNEFQNLYFSYVDLELLNCFLWVMVSDVSDQSVVFAYMPYSVFQNYENFT